MASLKKVMLIGNLGRDPDIRYTPDGAQVASFSLATTDFWTDKNGVRQQATEWHNIVAWSRLAELSKRFLAKGKQVYVEGRIRTREWTDRDGNKRRTTEIIASNMVRLGSRADTAEQAAAAAPVAAAVSEPEPQIPESGITDDDLPF